MSKKWIVIIVIALIVSLIGFNVWKSTATTTITVETVQLEKNTMTETVMTPGTLKLKEEQEVLFDPQKDAIAEILVAVGDKVKKGDPLLRYESDQLQLEQKQNELQRKTIFL